MITIDVTIFVGLGVHTVWTGLPLITCCIKLTTLLRAPQ